jgi:hypothetical protein
LGYGKDESSGMEWAVTCEWARRRCINDSLFKDPVHTCGY